MGLAQLGAEPYAIEANRRRSMDAIELAFGQGADLVVLPEMIVPGYVAETERLMHVAEPVPGPAPTPGETGGVRAGLWRQRSL